MIMASYSILESYLIQIDITELQASKRLI